MFVCLFSFRICSFNSTERFTVLNTEQVLIYSFCTLIPVLYCSFVTSTVSNTLIMKNFMLFFFLTMKTTASRLTDNLLQALGPDFLSAIKFLFITPQSLVAKIADIVVYILRAE